MAKQHADIIVVGGGILGLAHAYAAARRGLRVTLFERSKEALGASIQNFGTIWPVGLPPTEDYERSLYGRETWLQIAQEADIWVKQSGSLHLAYHPDELAVLEEYQSTLGQERGTSAMFTPKQIVEKSPAAKQDGLLGGLWSSTELTLYSPNAIRQLPHFLHERFGVDLRFSTAVTRIEIPCVYAGDEVWEAEQVFICSGTDFETLYPKEFAEVGITRCKLQMMRTVPQPDQWELGPILCSGLTLIHYDAFKECASLPDLRQRLELELPEYIDWHIHVPLAQTPAGELTIGDSHEYGGVVEPFNQEHINQLILGYLRQFAHVPTLDIGKRWHGVYPKIPGKQYWIGKPVPGVTIASIFGLGMTLSFGLARDNFQ